MAMAGEERRFTRRSALPDEALAYGGTEILRAGLIDGEALRHRETRASEILRNGATC